MQTESYYCEIPRTAEGEGSIGMDYGVPLPSWTQVVSCHGPQPIEKEGVTTYCKRAVRFADRRKPNRCLITLL